MKLTFFSILITLSVFTSCSVYNKVLKGDDYTKKFTLANDLYAKKKWQQSISLYEQVYQRLPKTGEGELSYYRIGKAYYNGKDYYMAGYYFNSFFDKYPYSTKVEETFFLKTLCGVKNSPNYSLDQTETELALNDIQQFIYLFPNSKRIDTCNQMMDGLRSRLELKQFEGIKLYAKTLNYKSAKTTAETFLNDHPASIYKEEVMYIKIKNSYFIAKNSIEEKKKERIEETIESYRNFATQYPESKFKKELELYEKSLQSQLNSLTIIK